MSAQDQTFTKIKALRTVNDEILSRIERKKKVTSFHYSITQISKDQTPCFELSELSKEEPTDEIVKKWKCKEKLIEIPDLFNDKLNYKVENFDDVAKCYKGMCSVIDRVYSFFGESMVNVSVLPNFKQNFEVVQVCFGEVENLILDQKSKKEALLKKVCALNQIAKDLALESNLVFGEFKGMGKSFQFVSDFDKNGILYWLGTNEGKEEYKNPADRGLVNVTAFQWVPSRGLPITDAICWNVIGGRAFTNYTNFNSPPSWIEISFSRHKVTPTYYSYRGDNNTANSYMPRNWNLEGSNDGNNWEILKKHTNDTTLQKVANCVGSWPVQNISKSYQRFRINQTGPNAFIGGTDYHLMIQGFEIYGSLENL